MEEWIKDLCITLIDNLPLGPEAKSQESIKRSGLKVFLPEKPASPHQGRRKFASVCKKKVKRDILTI